MRRIGLLILGLCALLAATTALRAVVRRAVDRGPRGLLGEPSRAAYVDGVEVLVDGGFVRSVHGRDVTIRATSLAPRLTLYSSSEVARRLRLDVTNVWRRQGKATLRVIRDEEAAPGRHERAGAVTLKPGERATIEVVGPRQGVHEFEFVVIEGGADGVGDVHALLRDLGSNPPTFVIYRDRRRTAGSVRDNWPLVELLEGRCFPVFVVPLHGHEERDGGAFAHLVGPDRLSFDCAGSRFLLAGLPSAPRGRGGNGDPLADLQTGGPDGLSLRRWLARELDRAPACDQAFLFVPFRHPCVPATGPLKDAMEAVLAKRKVRLCFVDVMALYELGDDGRFVELAAGRASQGETERCVAWRVRVRRDGHVSVLGAQVARDGLQRGLLMDEGAQAWAAAVRRRPWLGPAGVAVVAGWAVLVMAWVWPVVRGARERLSARLAVRAPGPGATLLRVLSAGLVVVLVAWFYLDGLGERHLDTSNEANRVEATREMLLRHDFVLPHINGRIYLAKPPLYYWLSAALWPGAPVGGAALDEFRARLPSVLAAFACLAVVGGFAWRWLGRASGALAPLLLAASPLFFLQAWEAELDMLLCTLTTLSLCLFYTAIWAERRRMAFWIAAFAGLAGAVMTKGPVPLAIVGLTLGTYLVVTRRQRPRCWPGLLAGTAVLLALVLPWCVAVVHRIGWRGAWDTLYQESAVRVARATEINRGSWHFYLTRLWPTFAPWSLWLPAAGMLIWRLRRQWRDDGEARLLLYLAAWFVPGFIFFSACAGKETQYVLPLYPALAMACGDLGVRWREGRLSRGESLALGAGTALGAVTMAGLGLAAPAVVAPRAAAAAPLMSLLGAVVVAAAVALLAAWRRRSVAGAVASVAVAFAAAKAAYVAVLVPWDIAQGSPRGFCYRVSELVPQDADIAMYGFERSTYSLYTGRVIRELRTESELLEKARSPRPMYFLIRQQAYEGLVAKYGAVGRLEVASLGAKPVYLVANPAAAGRPPPSPRGTAQ